MTIIERPLLGKVGIERRDLLVMPEEVVYSEGFEAGLDGWNIVNFDPEQYYWAGTGTPPRTGALSLNLYRYDEVNPARPARVVRTFTGLQVGRQYTIRGWSRHSSSASADWYLGALGVTGQGESQIALPAAPNTWGEVVHTFTATATSHELQITSNRIDTGKEVDLHWDDITLTAHEFVANDDWVPHTGPVTGVSIRRGGSRTGIGVKTDVGLLSFTLHNAEDPMDGGVFRPGQIVRAVVNGEPIFTGRVVDVGATYPLDKSTGISRTRTTITVADAVGVHATTPRYGAFIGDPFYETFEARIARLAGSAQTSVEVPVEGDPREVYSL